MAKILGTNIDTLLGIEPPEQLEKDFNRLKDKFGEYHWDKIENVIYAFEGQFYTIRIECQTQFRTDFDDRSQAAAYFKTCKYPSVMFAMYDGKDITSFIWKIIKKQFKNGTEENSILEVSR